MRRRVARVRTKPILGVDFTGRIKALDRSQSVVWKVVCGSSEEGGRSKQKEGRVANGNESGVVCTEAERQDMEKKMPQSSHMVGRSVVRAHVVTRGSAEDEEGGAAVAEPRVARQAVLRHDRRR